MCDAAEIEPVSENYEEQKMGKEAEECDPIAEKLEDPLAFKSLQTVLGRSVCQVPRSFRGQQ